jgi:hypothetical protein
LNFATPSKALFAIFMLCFIPAFLRDINIYLVLSEFTSDQPPYQHLIELLYSSVWYRMFSPKNINIISIGLVVH